MSYEDWKKENKSDSFAPFLKAKHIKSFPLSIDVKAVDQQKLPKTGPSLVARITFDSKIKSKLTSEYVKALEDMKAKDIAFPLNRTNEAAFVMIFGDNMKKWIGTVRLMAVPVTNPQTGALTQGLVVLTQGESK